MRGWISVHLFSESYLENKKIKFPNVKEFDVLMGFRRGEESSGGMKVILLSENIKCKKEQPIWYGAYYFLKCVPYYLNKGETEAYQENISRLKKVQECSFRV